MVVTGLCDLWQKLAHSMYDSNVIMYWALTLKCFDQENFHKKSACKTLTR